MKRLVGSAISSSKAEAGSLPSRLRSPGRGPSPKREKARQPSSATIRSSPSRRVARRGGFHAAYQLKLGVGCGLIGAAALIVGQNGAVRRRDAEASRGAQGSGAPQIQRDFRRTEDFVVQQWSSGRWSPGA